MALQSYCFTNIYFNQNRLFRGEPMDNSYSSATPANLFILFILGCLVNDAANKLLFLQSNPSGNVPFKLPEVLVRGELLDTATIHRRLNKPISMPSITSFSLFKDGVKQFNQVGSTCTRIIERNMPYPMIQKMEGEVIIPHGEQLAYTQCADGGLMAEIVRSPQLVKRADDMSLSALAYAYENHLSKSYKETSHSITLKGITIHRPNHGLAHNYRVMTYIPLVISYFAQHSKEAGFKDYCAQLTNEDIEYLRIAAVFRVTGRESELSFKDNLKQYLLYKQTSATHLSVYLKKSGTTDKMVQRLMHIVTHLGAPDYESRIGSHPALNQHTDQQERLCRNYCHRILTIAHNLDLARCKDPAYYKDTLSYCLQGVTHNVNLQEDYNYLLKYAIALIKSHDDSLCTDIDTNGVLSRCSKSYGSTFANASSSLLNLLDMDEDLQVQKEQHGIRMSCS